MRVLNQTDVDATNGIPPATTPPTDRSELTIKYKAYDNCVTPRCPICAQVMLPRMCRGGPGVTCECSNHNVNQRGQ